MMHSYPKVWSLGHKAVEGILEHEVVVQEKVDGSQFSFGVLGGTLRMRSKRAEVYEGTKDGLFESAAQTAQRLADEGLLVPGWVYRAEAVSQPRHNTLTYARVPRGNLVLFDVCLPGLENYLPASDLGRVAEELGIEACPTLAVGRVTVNELKGLLERESFLGGTKVEGVVVKAYGRFGADGKTLMAKLVRPEFAEENREAWRAKKQASRTSGVVEAVVETYKSEARWRKAMQHLREAGLLVNGPQDIPALMREVQRDVEEECKADIMEYMWRSLWPEIRRRIVGGLPEWYKERLQERLSDG